MPTYDVSRGDTVWALSRRALEEHLGRRPTNREVLEIVNKVSVPSGDVNLIFPGEQITIPVGPGYEEGPGRRPDSPPGTANQTPNNPPGVRPVPGRPDGGVYTTIDPPGARAAGEAIMNRPSVADPETMEAIRRFIGDPADGAATPDNRRFAPSVWNVRESFNPTEGNYRSFDPSSGGDWRQAAGEQFRDIAPVLGMYGGGYLAAARAARAARGIGGALSGLRPALGTGGRPALGMGSGGVGAPPALGPGGAGGFPGAIPLPSVAGAVPRPIPLPSGTGPLPVRPLGDAWGRYGTGYMF